ncbi:MAG: RNA methyltransferase [Clostridia bacterium]|nr:RNA methyltransferase [Clostridia bacterium]
MKMAPDVITSRKNAVLSAAAALREKKVRDRERAFLADGKKLFSELCKAGAEVRTVFLRADAEKDLFPVLERGEAILGRSFEVFRVAPEAFSRLTEQQAPDGIVSVAEFLSGRHGRVPAGGAIPAPAAGERALILSSLQDPGNLGAVARSALAFGTKKLYLSADCADFYAPKTLRASMGAFFHLDVTVCPDLALLVRALRAAGRRVLAAELREGAVPVSGARLSPRDVLIVGNEGHGIPPEVSAEADGRVFLPIAPEAESLTAAAAASVLLYLQREGGRERK